MVQQFSWIGEVPASIPQTPSSPRWRKDSKKPNLAALYARPRFTHRGKPKEIEGAYSLDLTDGRALLSLNGLEWRWTLMKGCGLDFEAMKAGDCAVTTLFKISVVLWVTAEDEVRMLVSYAYARALAEKIKDASGCQIVVAAKNRPKPSLSFKALLAKVSRDLMLPSRISRRLPLSRHSLLWLVPRMQMAP